jgi:hypothetical protein
VVEPSHLLDNNNSFLPVVTEQFFGFIWVLHGVWQVKMSDQQQVNSVDSSEENSSESGPNGVIMALSI